MTYETHITIAGSDYGKAALLVRAQFGWKLSKIDGDPDLGQKVFAYLTQHNARIDPALTRAQEMASSLRSAGVEVLRTKIEHIIFDTRRGDKLVP